MQQSRVVVVGAGFAGYWAARTLSRQADLEVVLINPTDYFLYYPLLPEVAAGVLEPRRVCVSLPRQLAGVRLVLGTVDRIDLDGQAVEWVDPEGRSGSLSYDRLILTVGSVNRLLPIPGVSERAHGFRSIAEALDLRDHVTRQLELAAASSDPAERAARCTFVVLGAGYTGTEVAAQGQLMTDQMAQRMPGLRGQRMRWLLVDTAGRVLPELDPRLSATAHRVLTDRCVEVRTGQSVSRADATGVSLTTGEYVEMHSLIWCVGVRPDPLVEDLGLPTARGRLTVSADLQVPGHPDVFAAGDCAAVPDLTRPGNLTGMTAQHAQRQGKRVGANVIASLRGRPGRDYRHRDLGFIVDLGGADAAADPLGLNLSGLPAKTVTRAYHLYSLPGNRIRTFTDWALNTVLTPPPPAELGLIRAGDVPLTEAARTK